MTTATPWCAPTGGSTTRRRSPRTATSSARRTTGSTTGPGGPTTCRSKGMQLGVYYNPLWATKSAVTNPSVTVVGRPDVKVARHRQRERLLRRRRAAAVGGHHPRRGRGVRQGLRGVLPRARRGVPPHRLPGVLRDRVRPERRHGGREPRSRLLPAGARSWMREAAGGMQLSLVLPNLFDHGAAEREYGDLIRIDNDAGFGTWFTFSGGRETWQPEWSQWNNPFMGFTGFADISGRGQVILDGDPLIMSDVHPRRGTPERHQSLHHGRRRHRHHRSGRHHRRTTPTSSRTARCWPCARRAWWASRSSTTATRSTTTPRAGTRNAGSASCPTDPGRSPCSTAPTPRRRHQVDRLRRRPRLHRSGRGARPLGAPGPGIHDRATRWPWGRTPPCSCRSCHRAPAHFQAEVGAWAGSAGFENTFGGHEGMGYVTDLETVGSSVAVAIAVPEAGSRRLLCRVANATGSPSTLTVRALDPADRPRPRLRHPPRAERAGVDRLADRARHAGHGGGNQPRGVQRRVVRPGRGQSRLRRLGLRSPVRLRRRATARSARPANRPASSGGRAWRTSENTSTPSGAPSRSPGGRPAASAAPARPRPAAAVRAAWRAAVRARVSPAHRTAGRRGSTRPGWRAAARCRARSGSSARRRA